VETPGTHGKPPSPPQLLQPVDLVQNTSNKSLSDMLRDGEIDALIGSRLPESLRTHPDKVMRLFEDPRAEEKRYYREHGIHPIMHTVAIQRHVYEQNRWIATSLFKAFLEARKWAIDKMYFSAAQRYMLPWLYDDLREVDEIFGNNLWAYGVEENRPTLQAFVKYMRQQHFIAQEMPVDELFVPIHGRIE
jgi:4,5-dihydroxyphthalate decarboxylase